MEAQENPIYTEIIVRDNGTGIQKEDLPHLFERFYRGKGTENTGVGIGLSLAAEIVRRQNGTIKAVRNFKSVFIKCCLKRKVTDLSYESHGTVTGLSYNLD